MSRLRRRHGRARLPHRPAGCKAHPRAPRPTVHCAQAVASPRRTRHGGPLARRRRRSAGVFPDLPTLRPATPAAPRSTTLTLRFRFGGRTRALPSSGPAHLRRGFRLAATTSDLPHDDDLDRLVAPRHTRPHGAKGRWKLLCAISGARSKEAGPGGRDWPVVTPDQGRLATFLGPRKCPKSAFPTAIAPCWTTSDGVDFRRTSYVPLLVFARGGVVLLPAAWKAMPCAASSLATLTTTPHG